MRKLGFAVAMALVPRAGMACAIMSPFQITDFAVADIVVAEARALLD